MKISLEQIDLLRERADVSYQDARDALEKCNNDIVEALLYLETQGKIKTKRKDECQNKLIDKIKNIVKKGNKTKFTIKNKDSVILNISVTLALIIGIVTMPFSVILLLIALFTGCKITIENEKGKNIEVNDIISKMSSSVKSEKNESDSINNKISEE